MGLISLAEYAKKHGKAPNTVRDMVMRGRLPAHKIGRNYVIDVDEPYPDDARRSASPAPAKKTQNGVAEAVAETKADKN